MWHYRQFIDITVTLTTGHNIDSVIDFVYSGIDYVDSDIDTVGSVIRYFNQLPALNIRIVWRT